MSKFAKSPNSQQQILSTTYCTVIQKVLLPYSVAVNTSRPYHGVVGPSLLYGNPVPHSNAIKASLPCHGSVDTTLPYGNPVAPLLHSTTVNASQPYHGLVRSTYLPTHSNPVNNPTIQCHTVRTYPPYNGPVGTSLLYDNPVGTPTIQCRS